MLCFEEEEEMIRVLRNKIHGLNHWIKNIRKRTERFCSSERVVWVWILEVPLHVWREDVFVKIAERWVKSL